jgi:hypothetical protein
MSALRSHQPNGPEVRAPSEPENSRMVRNPEVIPKR